MADLQQKLAAQGQRLADSLACWERVQAELQQENARLAAALGQRTADYQDMFQEKEVRAGFKGGAGLGWAGHGA